MTASRRDNLVGAGWLLADMSLNIWALSIVKALGLDYPAAQLVFLRAGVGLMLILPWIWRDRAAFAHVDRWRLHLLRVALSVTTLTASFFAIARLPFALFTALNFTRPLVLMAMAALILGEVIPRVRWFAAGVGLLGAAVAAAPGSVTWNWGLPALLITILAGTGAIIVTRALKGTPPVVMMAFYTGGLALATAPLAVANWTPIASDHLWPLLAIGAFAQTAQYCFLQAHWHADASVLGPLGYTSLILAAAIGFFVFGEIPTPGVALGAAIIVGASLLAAQR